MQQTEHKTVSTLIDTHSEYIRVLSKLKLIFANSTLEQYSVHDLKNNEHETVGNEKLN